MRQVGLKLISGRGPSAAAACQNNVPFLVVKRLNSSLEEIRYLPDEQTPWLAVSGGNSCAGRICHINFKPKNSAVGG
jgi:hypothetical protein